jgi:hypothetical protein
MIAPIAISSLFAATASILVPATRVVHDVDCFIPPVGSSLLHDLHVWMLGNDLFDTVGPQYGGQGRNVTHHDDDVALIVQQAGNLLALELTRHVLVRADIEDRLPRLQWLKGLSIDVDQRDASARISVVIFGVAALSTGLTTTASTFWATKVCIVAARMEGARRGVGTRGQASYRYPDECRIWREFRRPGRAAWHAELLRKRGVTVVNIDNGFGAACAADDILRLASGGLKQTFLGPALGTESGRASLKNHDANSPGESPRLYRLPATHQGSR